MFTIEEDSGTYTGSLCRHNGYYAGDFSRKPMGTATASSEVRAAPEIRRSMEGPPGPTR